MSSDRAFARRTSDEYDNALTFEEVMAARETDAGPARFAIPDIHSQKRVVRLAK